MIARAIFGLALLFCPLLAWAQGTGVVLQSGSITPGHTSKFVTNGVIGDAGGAAGATVAGGGYLTELGITNTGTPFCVTDGLISSVGGYHQLCLGANALGGGVISYNAYGGAAALPLSCAINGATYSCVNNGSGNVVGPNTSTVGDLAAFNGTQGTLLKDTGCQVTGSVITNCSAQGVIKNVVADCGAVGNDTADDTTAIQNCINGLPTQGGTIFFPAQYTFKTTGTLTIGNGSSSAGSTRSGVMLMGGGNPAGVAQFGPNNIGGPIIDYQGSGDAVQVAGPLQGWGLQSLYIKCASSTGTIGLHVISGAYGDSRNLRIGGCFTQIQSNTVVSMPSGYTTIDAIHNNYKNIALELTGAGSSGFVFDGNSLASPNSDTDFNQIDDLTIYFSTTASGTVYGVVLRVCDDNTLKNVHFTAAGGSATIKPYYFDYSLANFFPTSNVIDTTDPAMLGCGASCGTMDNGPSGHNFTNNGTPNAGTTPNYLNNLQLTNGARYPLNLSNLIIDHAQAAWTPTLAGSVSGSPTSYSSGQQNGWIAANGYNVTVYFNVGIPNVGTMTGNLLMTSLPVIVGGGNNEIPVCVVIANGVNFSGGRTQVYWAPQANLPQASFGEGGGVTGGSSAGALPIADIPATGFAVFGECSYHR